MKAFSKKCIKAWVSTHLSQNCTVISDGLPCFTALATAGHQHTGIITGGGSDSEKIPEIKWINTVISNVKRSLNGTFHAISKKYFPRYLAEFCYCFNRRYDLDQMIDRLCYIAVRTPPSSQNFLKEAEFHM